MYAHTYICILIMAGGHHRRRVMSVEEFEKMFDRYYERSTDRLRLRGESHQPRQFVSKECGYPGLASDPAAWATAQRSTASWPQPNMLDQNQTLILMDGEYAAGDTFQGCPGYFPAAQCPSKTFLFHTGAIFTNVQVNHSTCWHDVAWCT